MPRTGKDPPLPWHVIQHDELLTALKSSLNGLNSEEAQQRLEIYGLNRLTPAKQRSALQRLLAQFNNVLIYVLLAAAAMTAVLQHWVDTAVIIAVVILNALIGYIQEGNAKKALDAIRHMLTTQAAVKRDSKVTLITAGQLVPGDIVYLQSGDKIPADLRLLQTKQLRIDESILTGESLAVDKQSDVMPRQTPLSERCNMAYSGTLVTYGQGTGVVVATGDSTEIGHINQLLSQVQTLTTPLLKEMAQFGRWLTVAILAIASLTFLFGLLVRDYSAAGMFLAAVGLAVAAIPEGLPAIMTITLAIGVQRMARRNAIIRRLPAVETLGSVNVICSDKTGTLTRNEMMVQRVASAGNLFRVTGSGYDPHGTFSSQQDVEIDPTAHPTLMELARAAALCNDASVEQEPKGHWRLQGAPTEGALITLAMKVGLDLRLQYNEWPRSDIIPFESEHRFMATLHHDHTGHGFIYIKGAPEKLLAMCTHHRIRGEDMVIDHHYWQLQVETMAQQGQRVLAVAFKVAEHDQRTLNFNDVDTGLTLLGLIGMIDPPREEAALAIKKCHQAGITVKMITGDHGITAAAIAEQLGIPSGNGMMTGQQLDKLDDQELKHAIQHTHIFARTTPEHKLRLVTALQAQQQQVVAMTGDGVNDAPALKRADVGIAMGRKGTEVAKEAAEMVLVDDNFATITQAIEQGRTVYDNLKKAILFILPTNGGEALTILAAILLGMNLPITPVQILWVNMITAVTLALALAFEPPEPRVMKRPPRKHGEPLLSGFLIWRILFVSLILLAGTFGLFYWERVHGAPLEYARTVAVNTLVMFEIFYLFNARYINESACNWEGFFGNRYVLIAVGVLVVFQLAFTYLPPMQALFDTTALHAETWVRIILVAASVFVLVELEKRLLRNNTR